MMEGIPEEISDADLEQLLFQLNTESIKQFSNHYRKESRSLKTPATYQQFSKCLCDTISKNHRPNDLLLQTLFNRFKSQTSGDKIDILDFLLTMTILARIIYEKKLILVFQLCDDDEDGAMTTDQILEMLQRVEIIFAQEGKTKIESAILDHFIAKRKATLNM